jgi:hypothetical protein
VTWLTEVEQYRAGIVQQSEDAQRTFAGDQVEVRHAAPEQRVSLTKVVVDIQTRRHRDVLLASLVLLQQLGYHLAQGLDTIVAAVERGERHGVAQYAGADWMPLGMVRIQEVFWRCPKDHLG